MNRLSFTVLTQIELYLTPYELTRLEQVNTHLQKRDRHYVWWAVCHRKGYIEPILCDTVLCSWKSVYQRLQSVMVNHPPIPPDRLQAWMKNFPDPDSKYTYALVQCPWTLDIGNVLNNERHQTMWVSRTYLNPYISLYLQIHRNNTHWIYSPREEGTHLVYAYGIELEEPEELYDVAGGQKGMLHLTYLFENGEYMREYDYEYQVSGFDGFDTTVGHNLEGLMAAGVIQNDPDGVKIIVRPVSCLVEYTMN